jgi:dethiobiotin synthetase
MAPLNEHRTILDVMMALEMPLILVTGSYRGTISHTLTALDSLFRRDLNVIATIISETPGSPITLDDVVSVVSRFTEPVISLPRPRHAGGDPAASLGRLFDPQGRRTQSSGPNAKT